MRSTFHALAMAALSVMLWPTSQAIAQEEQIARGRVTALNGASLSVKVANRDMTFNVDRNTRVQAPGGSTKTRQAKELGKPGPGLADVLRIGQGVAVSYTNTGGTLHASTVRATPLVSHTASAASAATDKRSNGVVQSIGPNSMTITGSGGGGATFSQTFTIDPTTKVIGKGAGTAAASKGGRALATDLIKSGDRVSILYHAQGDALHASDVRVITKPAAR